MNHDIVQRAFDVFHDDLAAPPPVSLRGGNDLDSYNQPTPFDAAADEPTDAYLEAFAFWGLGFLDGRSWRHYLPRLIAYACRVPNDSAMVIQALVRSLRPPDRYPPRLLSLTAAQEAVVRAFLQQLAAGAADESTRRDAAQALEEWWGPNPHSRPTAADIAALRSTPVAYREVREDVYRITVPEAFVASGLRDIPSESRRVQTWHGPLSGDVPTMVAINVTPRSPGPLEKRLPIRTPILDVTVPPRTVSVAGAARAVRVEGVTRFENPAEPQTLVLVAAEDRELVMLSIRTWERDDVRRELERIVASFAIVGSSV